MNTIEDVQGPQLNLADEERLIGRAKEYAEAQERRPPPATEGMSFPKDFGHAR